MSELPRIFCDANDGFWLYADASRRDLEALGNRLSNGVRVILFMPQEFEIEAILSFDAKQGCWVGEPLRETIRYLDGSEPSE